MKSNKARSICEHDGGWMQEEEIFEKVMKMWEGAKSDDGEVWDDGRLREMEEMEDFFMQQVMLTQPIKEEEEDDEDGYGRVKTEMEDRSLERAALVEDSDLTQVANKISDLALCSIPKPISNLWDIPPILYRVYDNRSISKYYSSGFIAGSPSKLNSIAHFRDMLGSHIDWRNWHIKTPFISMTSSLMEVRRHVDMRRRNHRRNIMVAVIDTGILLVDCGAEIWEMHEAMRACGVGPPGCMPQSSFDHEYICTGEVPANAIIACCDPSELHAR